MREILFKAKRTDNDEWVEGYYQEHPKGYVHIQNSNNDCFPVYPDTICQYTGLTDKNGNKIWENDVVRCQDVIGKIGWNETHLAYTILAEVEESMRYYYIDESLSSDIETIGNIFDNPELLEGGAE